MDRHERLQAARKAAGYETAADAARALQIGFTTYAGHENGSRGFSSKATRYAQFFRVDLNWLLTGRGDMRGRSVNGAIGNGNDSIPQPAKIAHAPVRGIAQAGIWREHEEMDFAELDPVPVIPGKWAGLEQFAFKVEGPSMNRAGIVEGSFVVCVPYFQARRDWRTEDVVVVERRRGQIVERTVKRLRLVEDGAELWPESEDPRYQQPVFIAPNGGLHEDDGTEVEIIGLVIGVYRPL